MENQEELVTNKFIHCILTEHGKEPEQSSRSLLLEGVVAKFHKVISRKREIAKTIKDIKAFLWESCPGLALGH